MKICKTCKGNNFVRVEFEAEKSTMNCPDCTIDGKQNYLKRVGEQADKSLPPKKKVRLLTYQPIPSPYFFGHYKGVI